MSGLRPRTPFHPLLIAAYPVLFLAAANIREMQLGNALRALWVSVVLAALLTLLIRLLIGRWDPAALIASGVLLTFFSYGHVYDSLKTTEFAGVLIGRHRLLVPLFAVGLLAMIVWARRRQDWSVISPAFNWMSIVLVALPLFSIARFGILTRSQPDPLTIPEQDPNSVSVRRDSAPDIYYIILDAYTRRDSLLSTFGVDNTPFLDELKQLGFVIPGCSLSNYSQTELTLATTLNMAYLDDLGGSFDPTSNDRTRLFLLIRDNLVRRILEERGYRTLAFETGFAWSEWTDADGYYSPGQRSERAADLGIPLNAFESLLLESTALRASFDARIALPAALSMDLESPVELDRQRTLYVLDQLPAIASTPGPKFVFAHIVAPHRPYVFQPTPGSALVERSMIPGFEIKENRGYVLGYRNQVLYLNQRMPAILGQIIDHSSSPPIIIVQGDHGADDAPPRERMTNLTALYLPGLDADMVESSFSPVNDFRLILKAYFGYDLPLLDRQTAFSPYKTPYDLTTVVPYCPPPAEAE
ncbi:MAG: sulfatase-like hydrolase/transferase [Anaerolineales bacterium]